MGINPSIHKMLKENILFKPSMGSRPHVVILGAGASKEAMPEGDKFGRKIPLLDELPKLVELAPEWELLISNACPPPGNFESSFSWIKQKDIYSSQLSKIENIIESYFEGLYLPDYPTIYDYLVLGLRAKDIIATFNWDPFLMQAYRRNKDVVKLPDIRFLHGCVNFATCNDHDVLGIPSETCPICNTKLKRGKLFYPVENKDYTEDNLIKRDWEKVTEKLKEAFHLTIFGYSGPKTDSKARELILDKWNPTPMPKDFKQFCHAEIIDKKTEGESDGIFKERIEKRWIDYFPHAHSMIESNFWETSIALWPRRTFEWKYSVSIKGKPLFKNIGPYKTDSLKELQDWFSELGNAENKEESGTVLIN